MSFLILEKISKSFNGINVLNGINLEVKKSEFFSIVGPSGCGKTTLLRIIAGLEKPDTGRIILDGKEITYLEPQKRDVGIVFQNYALFPNMNVFENIAYGLKIKKFDKAVIEKKVIDILNKVQLSSKINSPVYSLSGGEQQRVSLARVIINEPKLILFDEPLSNLDYLLRIDTRAELKRLQHESEITSVYVTHDQSEALSLSDEMVVLNSGIIMQKGKPTEVYNNPANIFTAEFISHSNIFSKEESLNLLNLEINENQVTSVLQENLRFENEDSSDIVVSDIQFSGMFTEFLLKFRDKIFKSVIPYESNYDVKINDKVKLIIAKDKFKVIELN